MKELIDIISRFLVVLVAKNIISDNDRKFICGQMSESDWTESEAD